MSSPTGGRKKLSEGAICGKRRAGGSRHPDLVVGGVRGKGKKKRKRSLEGGRFQSGGVKALSGTP